MLRAGRDALSESCTQLGLQIRCQAGMRVPLLCNFTPIALRILERMRTGRRQQAPSPRL